MSDYYKFLENKKVVLVGPSPSLLGRNLSEWIDSFDVVVRMNRGVDCIDMMKSEVGKRVDVLYNCLHFGNGGGGNQDVNDWVRRKIKWLCCPYPDVSFSHNDIKLFHDKNKNRLPFHIFDKASYLNFAKKLGTRPNTGTLTIVDLLKSNLQTLDVVGMTFGIDGYYKQYENITKEQYLKRANSGHHKVLPQLNYVKDNIYKSDKRFRPDDVLKNILESDIKI